MRLSFLVVSMPIHKNSLKLTQIWWRSTQANRCPPSHLPFRCEALTSTGFFVFFLSLAVASQQHILVSEATGKYTYNNWKLPKKIKHYGFKNPPGKTSQISHPLSKHPMFFPDTHCFSRPWRPSWSSWKHAVVPVASTCFNPPWIETEPPKQITLETPSKMFSWVF